jgi:hypothetical protein
MTLTSRIRIAVLALLAALATTFGAGFLAYSAHADSPDSEPVVIAQADTGSEGSATAPLDAGSASAPAATPSPTTEPAPKLPDHPSVDQVTKLWRAGNFIATGALILYLLLSLALKVDKKHAFYISAGLAGVGMLVDAINRGDTPTLGMLVTAATTIAAIIVRGPEKKPAS